MARPLTKGAPIVVRLPLDVDAALRERAFRRGETPAAYIARLLTQRAGGDPPVVASPTPFGGRLVRR